MAQVDKFARALRIWIGATPAARARVQRTLEGLLEARAESLYERKHYTPPPPPVARGRGKKAPPPAPAPPPPPAEEEFDPVKLLAAVLDDLRDALRNEVVGEDVVRGNSDWEVEYLSKALTTLGYFHNGIEVDHLYGTCAAGVYTLRGRLIGETSIDDDTEVPERIDDQEIRDVLKELGGTAIRCNWTMDFIHGDKSSVYDFYVEFPLNQLALVRNLFSNSELLAMATGELQQVRARYE